MFIVRPAITGSKGRVKFIANGPFHLAEEVKFGNLNAINDYVLESVPLYYALIKEISGKKKYLNLELGNHIEFSYEPRTFIEPFLIDIDFDSGLVKNLNRIFDGIDFLPEVTQGLTIEEYCIEDIRSKYHL
jgi:hypothetical protein